MSGEIPDRVAFLHHLHQHKALNIALNMKNMAASRGLTYSRLNSYAITDFD
jgi:hypothetical protein